MRASVQLLAVALVATAAVVGVGLAVVGAQREPGTPERPRPVAAPAFRSVPLSAYDPSGLSVRRGAFCSRIDPQQVTSTLGGATTSQRAWDDGDRTALTAGLTDVAHEFGCEYAGDGVTARAWVFEPPVGRELASRWAKAAGADADAGSDAGGTCTVATARFGSPSGLLTCKTAQQRSATYRGLFGDAWLSCQLVVPLATTPAQLTDRAGRWCVGVARAAAAR